MFRDMNTEFRTKKSALSLTYCHLNVLIHFVEHNPIPIKKTGILTKKIWIIIIKKQVFLKGSYYRIKNVTNAFKNK
jgi:hypothetical protein